MQGDEPMGRNMPRRPAIGHPDFARRRGRRSEIGAAYPCVGVSGEGERQGRAYPIIGLRTFKTTFTNLGLPMCRATRSRPSWGF